MTAGTSTPRTNTASTAPPSATPMPMSLSRATSEVPMAAVETATAGGADVISLPVRPMPSTIVVRLSLQRTYSSRIRPSRNTS